MVLWDVLLVIGQTIAAHWCQLCAALDAAYAHLALAKESQIYCGSFPIDLNWDRDHFNKQKRHLHVAYAPQHLHVTSATPSHAPTIACYLGCQLPPMPRQSHVTSAANSLVRPDTRIMPRPGTRYWTALAGVGGVSLAHCNALSLVVTRHVFTGNNYN